MISQQHLDGVHNQFSHLRLQHTDLAHLQLHMAHNEHYHPKSPEDAAFNHLLKKHALESGYLISEYLANLIRQKQDRLHGENLENIIKTMAQILLEHAGNNHKLGIFLGTNQLMTTDLEVLDRAYNLREAAQRIHESGLHVVPALLDIVTKLPTMPVHQLQNVVKESYRKVIASADWGQYRQLKTPANIEKLVDAFYNDPLFAELAKGLPSANNVAHAVAALQKRKPLSFNSLTRGDGLEGVESKVRKLHDEGYQGMTLVNQATLALDNTYFDLPHLTDSLELKFIDHEYTSVPPDSSSYYMDVLGVAHHLYPKEFHTDMVTQATDNVRHHFQRQPQPQPQLPPHPQAHPQSQPQPHPHTQTQTHPQLPPQPHPQAQTQHQQPQHRTKFSDKTKVRMIVHRKPANEAGMDEMSKHLPRDKNLDSATEQELDHAFTQTKERALRLGGEQAAFEALTADNHSPTLEQAIQSYKTQHHQ